LHQFQDDLRGNKRAAWETKGNCVHAAVAAVAAVAVWVPGKVQKLTETDSKCTVLLVEHMSSTEAQTNEKFESGSQVSAQLFFWRCSMPVVIHALPPQSRN
jgi:hypothetical protein